MELEEDVEKFDPRVYCPSSQYCVSSWNMNMGRYCEINIVPSDRRHELGRPIGPLCY
jgi:hypothetical protein